MAPSSVYERMFHHLLELRRGMSGVHKVVLDWSSAALRHQHCANNNSSSNASSDTDGGNGGVVSPGKKLSRWQRAVAKKTVCRSDIGVSPHK